MNTINKDTIIFDELIKKQLKNINDELKLNYNDLKRLSLKIEKSARMSPHRFIRGVITGLSRFLLFHKQKF